MGTNDHELSVLRSGFKIRNREILHAEAIQASIDRIEAADGELNAVVTRRFERALKDAEGEIPDGPFKVPFF